ncbi:hypothetical protein [Streptomyces caniscabiei]|uniref:hypothetical protein n=1 Tax=Streptomyces caniscabiei TaxID=2746961 RepID=UPI0011814E00|nr:hypothetical protein [Streptomyces caniscabiei]
MSYRVVRGDNVPRATQRRTGLTCARVRAYAITLLFACSLTALAGCSDDSRQNEAAENDKAKASPSQAPSSPTAETSAAPSADPGAPIEAAYRKYWDEKVKAYEKASLQGTDLREYAAAEAFAQAEAEVKSLKAKGLVATGKPVLAPRVTSVDTERQVPQGSLTDCTDVSQWTLVKQSDGTAVTLPEGRLTRYVTKVVAEKWYGHWVIVKVTPEDQKC